MRYLELRNRMKPFILFTLNDIRRVESAFHRARLSEWQAKGYIRKLTRGRYMFTDREITEPVLFGIANRLCDPSYVSFETALAWYGLIPESVYQVTSASTRKTARFSTEVAGFSYRTLKPSLFWGYVLQEDAGEGFKIARPEKAILDFLYLHPSWSGEKDFAELRLDRVRYSEVVDREIFQAYLEKFAHKALRERAGRLVHLLSRKDGRDA